MSANITILADSCEFCEETIEVGSGLASIAGHSREETIIRSLEGNSVFTVETGTLDINNCHVKHMDGVNGSCNSFLEMSGNGKTTVKKCDVSCVDEENEVHSSAFKMNAGYTLLEEVRMFEMRFSSCSAIAFEQEAETFVLEIILTNFSKLTRSNGDGSIAEGKLSSGGKIIVSNCMLEESVCEDGNGGALNINVEDDGKIEVNGTEYTKFSKCRAQNAQSGQTRQSGYGGGIYVYFSDSSHSISLTNVSFEECGALVGSDMFINGNVLKEIVSNDTFNFSLDMNNLSALSGMERSASSTVIFPLVYFFRQLNGSAHVNGSEGTDFSGCGYIDCPCKTIEAAALRFHDQKRMIFLRQGFIFDHEVHLEDHEYVIGEENLSVSIRIDGSSEKKSDELLLVSISTTLDGISFILPSSLNQRSSLIRSSFDLSSPSTLSIKKCSFLLYTPEVISYELTYSLLSATGGNLIIERVSASNLIFGRCSALTVLLVTLNITEMTLYKTQATSICGLISLGKEKLFSSVISSPNAFIDKMPESTDILVNNSNFISCEAQNSLNGGCTFIEYREGMKLEIKDSVFMQCKAPRGKGGGVYLNCGCEGELSFQFTDDVFNMNDALSGRDIFVYCTSLEAQINEKQFNFCMEEPMYNTKNAIFGSDIQRGADEEDVNIIDLILRYLSDLIFIGSELNGGTILKDCGRSTVPCLTLNHGLGHLMQSFESRIVVNGSSTISSECNLQDLSIRSISKAKTSLHVNSDINRTRDSLMHCAGIVRIESQNFIFEKSFRSLHLAFFFFNSGEAIFTNCSFRPAEAESVPNILPDTMASIPFILMLVDSSDAILQSCELEDSSCKNSCFICKNSAKLQIQDFLCRRIVLNSALVIDMASTELSHICLDTVTCMTSIFESKGLNKNTSLEWIDARNITLKKGSVFSVYDAVQTEQKQPFVRKNMSFSSFRNVTSSDSSSTIFTFASRSCEVFLQNCSCSLSSSSGDKGQIASFSSLPKLKLDSCTFDGASIKENEACLHERNHVDLFHNDASNHSENEMSLNPQRSKISSSTVSEICSWNSSIVDITCCSVEDVDSSFVNAPSGALSVSGGDIRLKKVEFRNNSPSIHFYESARRNILCEDAAQIDVESLKKDDEAASRSSSWILNNGCNLSGIPSLMASPFFIPVLHSIRAQQSENEIELFFAGSLLLPCNLSFQIIICSENEEHIETYNFVVDDYVSENEIHSSITSSDFASITGNTEVRACILFGSAESPSSTQSFVLKNKSEANANGNERIAEGGKEGKSYWLLIVVVLVVILLIVLIGFILFVIRWKKVKNEAEDLREIVNDNIRKDPKAFEMVTMEMSPEEQWRRAEREAEKKNDERIKKRVYAKSLGHSESSEHLLSESRSTEYILGRDSDKIPQWMLEKVDEEEDEETRKRTPSPSISSTSTTDTSDTESTFVRGEDLCPTTSSMSNLVDAMACSSPHEKLIVDLRDSLFMLLHGKNEKKEMAIGTLKEREQTAAQVLFWVANLALHSFSEMDNPLQSLVNLSPHIVLFSEHMVICIVMHSDFSSDDDSDSSSISSSTVVTSASDDNEEEDDSLPSSAFEDEDDNFKKECLRWKAPELQMNKKMGATEKSVAFSIGMMLWECLTLQIPFGEYEAEAAGQKIVNGERPNIEIISESRMKGMVEKAMSMNAEHRHSLTQIKREFVELFPQSAMIFTITDAICLEEQNSNIDSMIERHSSQTSALKKD
ncbi:uncharacterized protein MONOS_1821 [Monocercomonoides exilis]|uniref:uncharacterized protein n=1 Tax=Monocercomonoides exilis TaxID=2049356 RepID=UPI00355A747E|nr:hypothetical protein MONOS_1821 [Monocercomonoides exilis]|eukprot:MONOS_1821.1-p1 / transcript=MONOS_1821.1 / gene=MONOS_1821 / organism=Monocercomonoides_exilis_PA203 / gene_product=unspecified product / transcript_product=unspecified product / location=Mono_scaffold00034:99512-104710(-) / protein_length=1732 / sequence_SO=supercontig / SO=protein_coding / is_pseudo=false